MYKKNVAQVLIFELSFIAAIIFYLYMGYVQSSWGIGCLGFILPFVVSIIYGDIVIDWNQAFNSGRKKGYLLVSIILLCLIWFFALGFLLN